MSSRKGFPTPWNVCRAWHYLTLLDTSEFAKLERLGRWIHASNVATQEPLRDVSVEQGTLAGIYRDYMGLLSKSIEMFQDLKICSSVSDCLSFQYRCRVRVPGCDTGAVDIRQRWPEHLMPSHLLIFSSSHLLIFSSSHLLIFSSSHLLIFSSSHLLICSCLSHLVHTTSYDHVERCWEYHFRVELHRWVSEDRSAMRWKTSRFGDSGINGTFMYSQTDIWWHLYSCNLMQLEVLSTFCSILGCLPDASICLNKAIAQEIPEQNNFVGILVSSFETS